jgi:hypothetical protein
MTRERWAEEVNAFLTPAWTPTHPNGSLPKIGAIFRSAKRLSIRFGTSADAQDSPTSG